jgi:pimeloyl-ACP methyl ester carboxylesterase
MITVEDQGWEGAGRPVEIATDGLGLRGDLRVPDDARGLVLLAHGGGDSRLYEPDARMAHWLAGAGLATLQCPLLTDDEMPVDAGPYRLRFDVTRLVERLVGATDWLAAQPALGHLPVGYFGVGTSAAAALVAAAERPEVVQAVVSQSGRPDLAGAALRWVRAPTLFIVGGDDVHVSRLNRRAMEELSVEKRLAVVPGADYLFHRPDAIERVADLTRRWFHDHV